MRDRALHVLLGCLLLTGVSQAAEEGSECEAKVQGLWTVLRSGASDWSETYEAYKGYKTSMEDLGKEIKAAKRAARDGDEAERKRLAALEAEMGRCGNAYGRMQKNVADALLRKSVPASGWIMGIFGALLLWGGLATCMGIAIRSGKSGVEQD
jgi:hypothetical protein